MKVSGSRGFDPVKLYSQTAKRPEGAGARQGAKADEVSISEQSKEIHRAMQALSSVPDVRVEKVESVRAKVDAGAYKVSGEEIVRALFGRAMRRGDLDEIRRGSDETS
ncbi:MAG: flagellar biosynthesis anti-sigma factor FlgM [Clostridia bacterium]|nr:flagellar biosynthesis anti-sigma factor FlgM [Clostridia bacterium]